MPTSTKRLIATPKTVRLTNSSRRAFHLVTDVTIEIDFGAENGLVSQRKAVFGSGKRAAIDNYTS